MTATNQSNRVEVRVYHSTTGPEDTASYTTREFSGYSLSPECGELFEKCQTLLVVSTNISGNNNTGSSSQLQRSIVAIPLLNALGLLALDFTSGLKVDTHVLQSPKGCSPGPIYHIHNSYYTLCSNSETGFVSLFKLRLNTTHFRESYLSHMEDIHLTHLINLTNSVYVELPSRSGNHIYFAANYTIFYYKPLDYIVEELDNIALAKNDCSPTELEYTGDWDMIVYCDNDQAFYVDLSRESSFNVDFAKDGRPYACPNPDVYLGVHSTAQYIEYGFFSTQATTDFEISMSMFDNGICFGSDSTTLFAFTDREIGTRVLNASGGFIMSLSDLTCINYSCQPLLLLEDRYLVVREKRQGDWQISVFDSHENFSLVRNVPHIKADLLAFVDKCVPTINEVSSSLVTVAPTIISDPGSRSHSSNNLIIAIVSGLAAGAAVLVVVCVIVTAVLLLVMRWQKNHQSCSGVVQVEQCGHNDSNLVSGIAVQGI